MVHEQMDKWTNAQMKMTGTFSHVYNLMYVYIHTHTCYSTHISE